MLSTLKIPGYKITEIIHEGLNTVVCRGISQSKQQRVILKFLKDEYPSLEQISRLKHEFNVTSHLHFNQDVNNQDTNYINGSGVVKVLGLETYQNRLVLVSEDFGGVSLKEFLSAKKEKISLVSFLSIAVQIAQGLALLHDYKIIHKDIKPSNIVINAQTGECKIIDFSIASNLSQETTQLMSPYELEGSLAYMSPEQTGRMNRMVDFRSDFYSLGVTFYEILTRQLPFQDLDAVELVYCHLAKQPTPVTVLNPDVPEIINAIVAKLMAKNAEDRYQSANSLLVNLRRCLDEVKTTGKIEYFDISSTSNISLASSFANPTNQVNIPQKLYGREKQVEELLEAFDRVSLGSVELVIVGGYSGVGKSVLVYEVLRNLTRQKGYFTSGKFDQFKTDGSLGSVREAFRGLIKQLLTENQNRLLYWQERFLAALGENGQIIIDVIPELELIIGKQTPVIELGVKESAGRFIDTFCKFTQAFSTKEHPLVIFMDDMQWADTNSLRSLQQIITNSENHHCLIILAYRDNEVNPIHPFIQTLSQIQTVMEERGGKITQITLSPLKLEDTTQLLADTLHLLPSTVKPLADLLHNKTQGNPFFLTQLLKSLENQKLLQLNYQKSSWQWDLQQIKNCNISDNVVDLMVDKLLQLQESTQKILKLAACIGNKFNLKTLATVNEKTLKQTATDLWPALQMGLILPLDDSYKIAEVLESEELEAVISQLDDVNSVGYKFLHDRVQQAAYVLIPDEEKQLTHLKIGQLLLGNRKVEVLEGNFDEINFDEVNIFDIVSHLNAGLELITNVEEKCQLAKLNLIAGSKAKASVVYEAAFRYFIIGSKLLNELSDKSWLTHYELTLALQEGVVETANLCGDFETMEIFVNNILQGAKNPLDCLKAYEIQIQAYTSQQRFAEAIASGRNGLKLFNKFFPVNLPETPTQQDIQHSLEEVIKLLDARKAEDLLNLPMMSEVKSLAIMRLLASIMAPSYIFAPPIFALAVLAQVKISILYGNTAISAFSYGAYAILLNSILQNLDATDQFGKLALQLVAKLNSKIMLAKVNVVVGQFVIHCKSHFRESLPLFLQGFQTGLEVSDLEYAGYNVAYLCQASYLVGNDLKKLSGEVENYAATLLKLRQFTSSNYIQIYLQAIQHLQVKKTASNINSNVTSNVTSDKLYITLTEAQDFLGLHFYWTHKLILSYLFGDISQATQDAIQARIYLSGGAGMITAPIFYFYDSLTYLSLYPQSSDKEELLKQVRENQTKLLHYCDHAPMNFQHKYDLVEAELCRVTGKDYEGIKYFEKAITGAAKNGYIQEEALANERAALFYVSLDKEKIAKMYMTDAYYGYIKWGATAKYLDLEKKYPDLIIRSTNLHSTNLHSTNINHTNIYNTNPTNEVTRVESVVSDKHTKTNTITTKQTLESSTHKSEILDLATVIKASSAIMSEIHLENLPFKLLHIILENAGAQKGCLILEKNNQFFVEAINSWDGNNNLNRPSILVDESLDIPQTVINYVINTQEILVLANASVDPITKNCPYIQKHQCQSILCLPILAQGKLIGLFYLENNLTTGVFTSSRLELMKILASQGAIAINNARLLAREQEKSQQLQQYILELAQKEEQYRSIFESVNDGMTIHNLETGNTIEANPKAYQMYGFTKEEYLGLTPLDYLHPDYLYLFSNFIETIKAGKEFYCQGVGIKKDGSLWNFKAKGTLCTYNGKPHGLVIFQDISAEIAGEAQIKQKSADLEQALLKLQNTQSQLIQTEKISALGQLVAGVAHEVNNPVSFINGNLAHAKNYIEDLTNHLNLYQKYYPNPLEEIQENAEEIELEYLLEDLPKMISSMKLGTERIRDIMQSLRNYSRKDGVEKQPTDIHKGIDSTLIVLSHRLKATPQNPAIKVIKEYGNLPEIPCFSGQLNQVFMNLIANAIDAMEESNNDKTVMEIQQNPNIITIKTSLENDYAVIRIGDNGNGIPEAIKEKLFTTFFTTKAEGKGTGLGLSISKEIVENKHGGKLTLESEVGKGTEFIIQIPRS
jgi:PAS domain S-box-containing protein